jgi:hypothetical protein
MTLSRSGDLLALSLGLLVAQSAAATDFVIHYDATKGQCRLKDDNGEAIVTCPKAVGPSIDLGAATIADLSKDPVEYRLTGTRGKRLETQLATGRLTIRATDPIGADQARPATLIATAATNTPVITANSTAGPQIEVGTTPLTEAAKTQLAEQAGLPDRTLQQNQKEFIFDFSIPESPGFAILGLTPQTVDHPRTLRELALSLKNGIDENGKYKAGLAIDFAPLQLWGDDSLAAYLGTTEIAKVPEEYSVNSLSQALTNTSVSIATTQGTSSDDQSLKLGLGVHVPIIDRSDGRNDYALIRCYDRIFSKAMTELEKLGPGATDKFDERGFEQEAQRCFNQRDSARWNASVWTVSAGYSLASESGDLGASRPGARGLWTSYAYGFEGGPKALRDHAQVILHAKWLYKELVAESQDDDALIERDNALIGTALRFGSDAFNASLQGSYAWIDDRTNHKKDEIQRLAIGIEYRVAKDVWLVATVGGKSGDEVSGTDSFVLGELKFGSATSSQFDPRK